MDENWIINCLIGYLCFLPALTIHECAHAWTAWKCGDDTARLQGRITLNPVAHMDLVGTVLLPLLSAYLAAKQSPLAALVIGWGKPVPVNPMNLRHLRRDDTLVSIAGPVSNLLLAFFLMLLARAAVLLPTPQIAHTFYQITLISLVLCFFNLLPIPPLDGSHVLKNIVRMSHESYLRLSQYGLFLLIVAINLDPVQQLVSTLTMHCFMGLFWLFQFPVAALGPISG